MTVEVENNKYKLIKDYKDGFDKDLFLERYTSYFENYDYEVTQVSVKLTPGVSGSAIIDSHGNLLCMAAFYWVHDGNTEYYGISLTDILDYYKDVFGKPLEYY